MRAEIRHRKDSMKKIIIGVIFMALFIACAIGAFFFFSKAKEEKKASIVPDVVGMKNIVVDQGGALPDLRKGLKKTETVLKVEVNSSSVNLLKEGEYPIVYKYQDKKKKWHEKKITCTVKAKESVVKEVDQEIASTSQQTENTNQEPIEGRMQAPKTNDEWNLVMYLILNTLSSVVLAYAIFVFFRPTKKI